jgi:hypothetical protein
MARANARRLCRSKEIVISAAEPQDYVCELFFVGRSMRGGAQPASRYTGEDADVCHEIECIDELPCGKI